MSIIGETKGQKGEREKLRDDIFRHSERAGQYLDQFTTLTSEQSKQIYGDLTRLPKCLTRNKEGKRGPKRQITETLAGNGEQSRKTAR